MADGDLLAGALDMVWATMTHILNLIIALAGLLAARNVQRGGYRPKAGGKVVTPPRGRSSVVHHANP